MLDNSKDLHLVDEEYVLDTQSAENEAPCRCNPPSSRVETASISSPPEHNPFDEKQSEVSLSAAAEAFCLVDDNADMTSPRVLTASDFAYKPSSMKERKARRKHRIEAFKKLPVLGVMQNDCSVWSRNWLPSPKWRAPKSPSKGFKPQHAKSKAFHMAEELVGSKEQIPCANGDLHSDYSVNAPISLPVKGVSIENNNDENYCCTYDSTEGYDAITGKQEGVVNGNLCLYLLTWFPGLVVRALRSQWNFFFHLLLSLMLAWYHSVLFALHPLSYMLHVRGKATEAYKRKKSDTEKLGLKLRTRVLVVRPTLATGARKLTFGCLTALYSISVLTCLFVASFMLSFFVVKGFVYEPLQRHEYLFFDYTKQLPVASIDFTHSVMYPPTGSLLNRLACPARNFHATVYLTVPESDFNKELGIFQVTSELISATGQVLLSKTQPCMLRFRSTILQHIKAFLMAVPLLAGSYLETQTLAVSSLKWQEQRALSSAALRVVLAPRAGRPLLTGLPELYEAGISLKSELPWWLSVIGNWRWTLSVWLGLVLFIGVVLVLGLCTQFLLPDLGVVFSIISKGIAQKEKYTVKAAYHTHEKLSAVPALGREKDEFVIEDIT